MDTITRAPRLQAESDDPVEQRAAVGFDAVQAAFGESLAQVDIRSVSDIRDVIAGMLCSVVDLALAHTACTDTAHVKLRGELVDCMGPAVTMARHARGLPPLPEGSAP
ncbi:hypothetical protein [Ponticoccus alexandrii]|uniref:STAS domain-containing protein n=1 Tax=Ponticoccus alexandrii TaxID=1943633 RepID=A0ABX7F801_9RHOB|nr:hypothetical protein [Ponticoccus alexandrii]ETA54005.1 hypothetical protein P279_00210 [Rhodobacteraceae bacterium PD-2]QRF66355.1 hypothetical protein GQA70_08560 [Ponticoccus alexandrii]